MYQMLTITFLFLFLAADKTPEQPVGLVSGTVLDVDSHQALGNANVRVLGTSLSAQATPEGTFEIHDVPAGQYRIQATYVGYCPESVDVRVASGDRAQVNVVIRVGPGCRTKPITFSPSPEQPDAHQAAADSVKLLVVHDRSLVTIGKPIQLELALENNSSIGLRFPADLRPYVKAMYLYPNGDRDSVPCWIWKKFDGLKKQTILIRPGERHAQHVVIPGSGVPGEYEIRIMLHSFGSKWKDMPDQSYASNTITVPVIR